MLFRKNVSDFIHSLDKFGAPLVIFSAGIGDVIEVVIEDTIGIIPKCVHIVSNMIQYENVNKNFKKIIFLFRIVASLLANQLSIHLIKIHQLYKKTLHFIMK